MNRFKRLRLPPDPEQMNEKRAQWAAEALEAFERYGESAEKDSSEEECRALMEQNLSDLLADFAHLCDRKGLNMTNIIRIAMEHYSEETDCVGDQFSQRLALISLITQ